MIASPPSCGESDGCAAGVVQGPVAKGLFGSLSKRSPMAICLAVSISIVVERLKAMSPRDRSHSGSACSVALHNNNTPRQRGIITFLSALLLQLTQASMIREPVTEDDHSILLCALYMP